MTREKKKEEPIKKEKIEKSKKKESEWNIRKK